MQRDHELRSLPLHSGSESDLQAMGSCPRFQGTVLSQCDSQLSVTAAKYREEQLRERKFTLLMALEISAQGQLAPLLPAYGEIETWRNV